MSSSRRIVLLPGPAGDRAMVTRLLAGEEQAYRDCYETHAPRSLALLVRLLGDRGRAEEILQETFAAVFRKVDQYRGESQFGTWISGIAIRRALNSIRDETRRIPALTDVDAGHDRDDPGVNEEHQLTQRDLARRVLTLVDRLNPEKRIAILLHAEGYTAAEIGEMTRAPRATILARISRARAELLRIAAEVGLSEESSLVERTLG
jgi:RNA polymerase sigma-70 factor (ECF subfamily)